MTTSSDRKMRSYCGEKLAIGKQIVDHSKENRSNLSLVPVRRSCNLNFLSNTSPAEKMWHGKTPQPEEEPFLEKRAGQANLNTASAKKLRWSAIFFITTNITTLVIFLIYVIRPPYHYRRMDTDKPELSYQGGTHIIEHCGDSLEEAQARGCIFDLMSFRWIHPACFNRNESEAWLESYGPWEWYMEKNNTESVVGVDVLPYQTRAWTQQSYHVAHCLYVWKLLHLAAISGSLIDDETIVISHSDHCAKIVMKYESIPSQNVVTRVDMSYSKCVTLY